MENYDILTNGFFSSLPFPSLSLPTIFAVFSFFACYLFRLKKHTLLRGVFFFFVLLLFCFHHLKILMDFFNFPKKVEKRARRERREEKGKKKSFRGSLSLFMIVVEHNYWISQGWEFLALGAYFH
jgi:hypothetical protein